MLPKDLLEVKKIKGKIYPKFAGKEDLELAEKVISVFKLGKGRKYGSVLRALKKLENAENFKRVRGFARILENYCIEKACSYANTDFNPIEVRHFLFEKGFVTSKEERDRVIQYAAKYFNTSVEEIERAMYADREEELIVTRVEEMDANRLIKLYNLSLLQTAVFNCLKLTFWVSSNHKYVFRSIKWNGLMYELHESSERDSSEHGSEVVEVTGPASMIKMTRRYGVAMAKVIPYIVSAKKWYIKAEILDGGKIYLMEVDDRLKSLFPKVSVEKDYDSSLEAEFSRRLRNLGYDVVREPGVVKAGEYAFIPDFFVSKNGVGVYVELAGFWTPEYLKKKAEKVEKAKIPLVVVANEEFGEVSARSAKLEGVEVVIFSRRINYGDVVRAISRLIKEKGVKGIEIGEGNREGRESFVKRELLDEKELTKALEEIREVLAKKEVKTLGELSSLLEKYGLKADTSIVEKLGYKIVWKGLEAEVRKV